MPPSRNLLTKIIPMILFIFIVGINYLCWHILTDHDTISQYAAFIVTLFGLLDWLMLTLLPHLGLSYARVGFTWIFILLGRLFLSFIVILPLKFVFLLSPGVQTVHLGMGTLITWTVINLLASIIEFYSMYIEPFHLKVTRIQLQAPKFLPNRCLRIIQLSDIHIERLTKRERAILQKVKELQPDIIVLTGDYLNYDYVHDVRTRQDATIFLSKLYAPYGIYAIPGSLAVDLPDIMDAVFHSTDITMLDNRAQLLTLEGGQLFIAGVKIDKSRGDHQILTRLMQDAPPDAYSLLLYHSPDLIETAAKNGVHLYLAGHTHGGQIRLPIIGALVTLSAYGRKYASGMHQLGPTTLYTSRGLGMEGLNLPRARFLCPPEIVLFELGAA